MSLEIERKFLVANEGWKTAVIRSVRVRDGLIANNKGHKARVRIANDVATIALKSPRPVTPMHARRRVRRVPPKAWPCQRAFRPLPRDSGGPHPTGLPRSPKSAQTPRKR